MSRIPAPQVDCADFLFDFSPRKSCYAGPGLGLGYQQPQQTKIPTPVFHHESPLFKHGGPEDSASGPTDPSTPGPSRAELEGRSARPYAARVSDREDFAYVYERTIVPVIVDILQANCDCDFSVDVHNFPELSSQTVPRVVYITLPFAASGQLQELVRHELARNLPARFHQTHLKFRQGSVKKTTWWGTDNKHPDDVQLPRNGMFHPVPHIGISVGPHCSHEDGGSAGGFLKVGESLYGVSCRHVVESALQEGDGDTRLVHPAHGDHRLNQAMHPCSQQSTVGSIFLCSRKDRTTKKDVTRASLTFEGSGVSESQNRVTMDWCLFGPVPEGKNFLSVPTFDMDRLVAVEKSAMIEGNTEVYALARTSGYSLGYTSDVPGVQKLEGTLRREWTVRQYSPSKWDPAIHLEPPWQSVKSWVTSGIGVPGDSGAWLMRRSDNAVIGLIWARNHNHGSPVERIRLTYVTPIVDVLADVKERDLSEVSLPTYSQAEIGYAAESAHVRHGVSALAHPDEPWNHLSVQLGGPRSEEESTIDSTLSGSNVPSLPPRPMSVPGSSGAGEQAGRVEDDITLPSSSSMYVQPSPERSDLGGSDDRSSAGARRRFRDMTLFAIGVAEALKLRRPASITTPPDLETDSGGADSSVSGETLDGRDSSSVASVPVAIADPDGSGDGHQVVEGSDPVRSKARFASADLTPALLNHRTILA